MRPTPTIICSDTVASEKTRWNSLFQGEQYYYGYDPGPVARRAVRYHRSLSASPGRALDAGCGEGQDLLFLLQQGYDATGIEFTVNGATKAQSLLEKNGFSAQIRQEDLRHCPLETYDLVIAVNSVQFLGADAPLVLNRLITSVAPGGVLGLSLFAREDHEEVESTIWRTTLADLQSIFSGWQLLETANLWQWNIQSNRPQAFVTLIAMKKL